MDWIETYLSLGSNLGDRTAHIHAALQLLDESLGRPHAALSSLLETEPWGFESEERFINCVVRYDVSCGPEKLLEICKDIERKLGREVSAPEYDASGERIYHNRPIDIDILFYGRTRCSTPDLVIPHPLMKMRDFVMNPLLEIVSKDILMSFPEIFQGNCE